MGCPLAQLVEGASHVQRPGLTAAAWGFESLAACDNMTDGLEAQCMNLVVVFKANINSILNLLWLSLVKNHIVCSV